jgi:molecular chaperone DnaJ
MAAQREWYEKDYYKILGVGGRRRQGHHQGVPQARARQPPRHAPRRRRRPRSGSRKSALPTTCWATTRSARSTTRFAGSAPRAVPRRPGVAGPAGTTSTSAPMASATCSARCSTVAVAVVAPRRPPGRSAAPTSRPRSRSTSSTPRRASPPRCYLTSDAQCSTCNGSGAKPGTQPKVCSQCGGRGVVDDNQGFFSFSSPCRACGGGGVTIEQPCPTCHGSRVERRAS